MVKKGVFQCGGGLIEEKNNWVQEIDERRRCRGDSFFFLVYNV